ncbi:MAG: hypothetical protein IPK68_20060 [Bdellovibrionales bacterium]|nr:hypothetical protein [Bdellovibrionales bacterium]
MTKIMLSLLVALTIGLQSCQKSDSKPDNASNNGNGNGNGNGVGVDQDEQSALEEIAKLTKEQCQEAFQKLTDFYKATEGMTEEQRKAFFDNIINQALQHGQQPPPRPPAIDSKVFKALETCAKG